MTNKRTVSLMILGAVLVGIGAVGSGIPSAFAAANSITVADSTVSLFGSTTVDLCAGDNTITVISAVLTGPGGADAGVDATISAITPLAIAPGTCNTWDVPADFGTTLATVGAHAVLIGTAEGPTFFVDFAVSFNVVPESPIGIAAIMGSALAALGAFVGIRHRKAARI